jgi:metal-responsive CopG/Arc/MetJ family transcriptional regulator
MSDNIMISAYFPKSIVDQLDQKARDNCLSRSDVLRQLVIGGLESGSEIGISIR